MRKSVLIILTFIQSYCFAQNDSTVIYLKVHATGSFYTYNNFKENILSPGVLLSATDEKVELSVGFFYDSHTFYNVNRFRSAQVWHYDTVRYSYFLIPIFLNYYFSGNKIKPFLSVGVIIKKGIKKEGIVNTNDIVYEKQYETPLHLGIGISYPLTNNLNAFLEPYLRASITKDFWTREVEPLHFFPGLLIGLTFNFYKFNK